MLEKVYQDRLAKLEKLRELGFDPYGGRYDSAEDTASIVGRYKDGEEGQSADTAGRVVLYRAMGKLIFAHLRDHTGAMQVAFRRDVLDAKTWEMVKLLDLGDIVAASGPLMRTRTGEVTIFADKVSLLTKSLLPMPEKFHGLQDLETRYRQRYLDLMTNPESMAVFYKRLAILGKFRELLSRRGFVEVETPILQAQYGGAAARPFVTHHNTLDVDLFLRISPELYLKRLLVGGMPKVFEIGRQFRNEGMSPRHNPEFTMMELYQAYADYNVMMEITEELVSTAGREICLSPLMAACDRAIAAQQKAQTTAGEGAAQKSPEEIKELFRKELAGNANVTMEELELLVPYWEANKIALPYCGRVIDFTPPWPRKKYADLIQEHAGVDWKDDAAVRAKAKALGLTESNKDLAVVVNDIFESVVEPELAKSDKPVFVIDYPAAICPLTRRKADDPTVALRFECFVAGMELANAYTELNDPAVQEANFRQQLKGEAANETMRVMDEDFVAALRHGMPPAGGLGIGIDRAVMLLTNSASIRDVIFFPLLRPTTT